MALGRGFASPKLEQHDHLRVVFSFLRLDRGMKPLKSIVRPSLITTFLIVVWLDFIILPIVDAFKGIEHVPYTTPEFWMGFAVVISSYVVGRSAEKIKGVEPENTK